MVYDEKERQSQKLAMGGVHEPGIFLKKLNADKFFFWISVCHFMTHFPCFLCLHNENLKQPKILG